MNQTILTYKTIIRGGIIEDEAYRCKRRLSGKSSFYGWR